MSSSFTFVDALPPRQDLGRRRDPLIAEFAEACKEPDNVGKYSVYPKSLALATQRAYASAINHGRSTAPAGLGTGEFEADVRDGKLYIRCKPEDA